MSSQSTMDFSRHPEPADEVNEEPGFWIEEIRLLKSFSPDPDEQIREPITFQKGLNIVWAPAPPMDQRKEVNFAGHAAGKTTLCRLLRYLLGEHNTAAPGVKEAIEDTFYNGWIVGKIHVGTQPWIVARPLHHATRPRSRCIKSDSIDELLNSPDKHLTWNDFGLDLHNAIIEPLPVKLFGDGVTDIELEHVLQWFTRDQDCHLTKLYEFRHPDSKSESPKLTSEAAHFLQRIILNLADSDLQKAITSCENLEKEEAKLPSQKEYLLRREDELNLSLEKLDIRKPDSPKLTAMEIESAKITAEELEEETTKNVSKAIDLAKGTRDELQKKLSPLLEKLGTIKANVATALESQKEAKDTLNGLDGKKFDLAVEKEKAKKRPPSAYCRVPREIAKECKMFCEWDVPSSNEEDAEKLILSQKQAQQKYLTTCTANLNNFKREQTQVEANINQLRKNIEDISEKVTTLQEKRKELQKPFASIGLYIDELEQVINKLADLRSREKTLKSDVENAKKLQEKLQKRHLKTENQFVDEYAWTVAQIFGGKETVTKCSFTREKITTTINYHGKDLTSAAVTALQILCFDIAAMAFSCRGRGFHPRFLLHDSPREADMGEAPYGRIFDLIAGQATETPNFQHIITTTTEPPKEYQQAPYLRLKLDSVKPSGRLFQQDL